MHFYALSCCNFSGPILRCCTFWLNFFFFIHMLNVIPRLFTKCVIEAYDITILLFLSVIQAGFSVPTSPVVQFVPLYCQRCLRSGYPNCELHQHVTEEVSEHFIYSQIAKEKKHEFLCKGMSSLSHFSDLWLNMKHFTAWTCIFVL